MPQFDTSSFISQIFWLVIVLCIIYLVMSKFIIPKVESIFIARNLLIENNIHYAENCTNKAKILDGRKKECLIEMHKQIDSMRQEALKSLDLRLSQEKELSLQSLTSKTNHELMEIEHYIHMCRAEKTNACIKLVALLINKITHRPADINLIKEIYGRK